MWCHPAVISCLKTPHGYYVVICVSYQKPLELAPNPWRAIDPHLLKSHPGPGEYFLSESAPRRIHIGRVFFHVWLVKIMKVKKNPWFQSPPTSHVSQPHKKTKPQAVEADDLMVPPSHGPAMPSSAGHQSSAWWHWPVWGAPHPELGWSMGKKAAKTMGKPEENHRNIQEKHGFHGIYKLI